MTKSQIIKLGNDLYEQMDISPAQLEVTSRQINYWIDNVLVPFVEKQQPIDNLPQDSKMPEDGKAHTKTKWIRLNLSQAVWVCIIKELLSFGVSVEKLAILARFIWQKPREDKYADRVFKDHIENNWNHFSKEEINEIAMSSKDELLMEYYYRTIINPFTDMIKSALLRETLPHSMLYVPQTNEHSFLVGDNCLTLKLGGAYLQHPMICIPIMPIISKVLAVDFNNPKKDLLYLSDIEKEIRDIVVFKKPKVVVLSFEDERITPITITEDHKSKEELVRYILENKIAKGSKLLIEIRSQGNYKLTLIKK